MVAREGVQQPAIRERLISPLLREPLWIPLLSLFRVLLPPLLLLPQLMAGAAEGHGDAWFDRVAQPLEVMLTSSPLSLDSADGRLMKWGRAPYVRCAGWSLGC